MSQKFKSDIETQAGLIDSFGFSGSAGQILSSTGTKTEWITPPQSPGGGGSSQVFYFNGGTASSVGGYYQMSPVANTSTGVDFTINANGYIASFLTDVNSPNQLNIPAGNWNFEIYFSASSGGGSPSFYVELYKYSSSTFTLIASSSATPEGITNGTAIDLYITALAVPTTTLLATDRLAVRVYVTHSGRTIKMHTQNGHLSEVITTFSTGLTALNGLTEQVQYFATGAGGTDFNIASAVNTHTFNLPTASATNRGALSSADWTTFNSKANASGTTNYVSKFTGTTSLGDSQIFDNGTNVGIGTTTPGAKLDVSSGNINLSNSFNLTARNNANTFNIALIGRSSTDRVIIDADGYGTNIGGGGTVLINPSGGNVGIGTTSPASKLNVLGSGTTAISISNSNAGTSGSPELTQLNFLGFLQENRARIEATDVASSANGSELRFYNANTSNVLTERMRIASNGAVKFNAYGSGTFTGTATQKLAVDSSGNIIEIPIGAGPVDGSGTTNYVTKWTDADTIGNSIMFDNGTNVGIGTTSPSQLLHLYKASSDVLIALQKGSNYGYVVNDGTNIGFASDLGSSGYKFLVNRAAPDNAMIINATGNVGIGTTSPTGPLHIVKSGGARINLGDSQNTVAISSIEEVGDSAIGFYTQTSIERMRIASSGNVGIGTTAPVAKLDVNGHINVTSAAINFAGSGSPLNTDPAIYRVGGVNDLAFAIGSTERMRITSAGNVGIGTSSPSYKTVIHSSSVDTDVLCVSNDQINADSIQHFVGISLQDQYSNGSGNVSAIRSYSNLYAQWGSTLTFSTTGTAGNGIYERMRITNTGNVGIGNTNPGAKLDVSGNIFCRTGAGIYSNVYSPYTGNMTIELGGNNLIVSNGNVGIGTTSPATKLEVSGRTLVNEFQYTKAINISSANLNDYTFAGFYNGESMTNAPNSGWFWVTVERYSGDDNWAHQTATSFGAGNDANIIYSRTKTGGTWTAWKQLTTSSDISGTTNYVSKFTGANSLGNSQLFDNGTNVGIGTSSPTEKLEVQNAGSGAKIKVSNSAGGYASLECSSNASSVAQLSFTNQLSLIGGNVGIGTTAPTARLTVSGSIHLGSYSDSSTVNIDNRTSRNVFTISTDGVVNAGGTTLSYSWANGGQGPLKFANASGEVMRLDASGNLGIGTTSPTAKLEVSGAGIFRDKLIISADAGNEQFVIQRASDTNSQLILGYHSSGYSRIQSVQQGVGYTPLVLQGAGGNVGIGTSSPVSLLQVSKDQAADTAITVTNAGTVGSTTTMSFVLQEAGTPQGWFRRYRDGSGLNEIGFNTDLAFSGNVASTKTERMRITSSGNVGIGTSSPTFKLEVNGSVHVGNSSVNASGYSNAMEIVNTTGSPTSLFLYQLGIGSGHIGFRSNDSNLYIVNSYTDGSITNPSAITLTGAGNVGIGTSSPGAKLDVNGDALINGLTVGRGGGNISTNTVIGNGALASTSSGGYNIAIGYIANSNSNVSGLTAIGAGLQYDTNLNNLEGDCLAISQTNGNADASQVPHIYAPKPISIGGGATNIITFDLLHYAGAIVEYMIRLDDGDDYALGTVYMGWKSLGSGNMIDVRQIEWSDMSGFVFSLGGSGQTLVLTNTSGNNAWIRITVRGMMTN